MSGAYFVDEGNTPSSLLSDKESIKDEIEAMFLKNSIENIKKFCTSVNETVNNLIQHPLQNNKFDENSSLIKLVKEIPHAMKVLTLAGFQAVDNGLEFNTVDHTLIAYLQDHLLSMLNQYKAKSPSQGPVQLDNFEVNSNHFSANNTNLLSALPESQNAGYFTDQQKELVNNEIKQHTNNSDSEDYEIIERTPALGPSNPTQINNNIEGEQGEEGEIGERGENSNSSPKRIPVEDVEGVASRPVSNINNINSNNHQSNNSNDSIQPVQANGIFSDFDSKVAALLECGFSIKQAHYALKETKYNVDLAIALLCNAPPDDSQLPDVVSSKQDKEVNNHQNNNFTTNNTHSNNNNNHVSPMNSNTNIQTNPNNSANNNVVHDEKQTNNNNSTNNTDNTNNSNNINQPNISTTPTINNSKDTNNNKQPNINSQSIEDKMYALIELGFGEELVRDALEKSNYNVERASNLLFSGPSLNKQKSEDINSVLARLDAEERDAKEIARVKEELDSEIMMEKLKQDEQRAIDERKNKLAAQAIADSENVKNYLITELHNGKRLTIQQHNYILAPSTHTADSQYSCTVCFCDYNIDEIVILDTCKHFLCLTCMKTYITTAINDGRSSDMRCPYTDPECKRIITHTEVQRIVDQKEFEKYQSFMLESHLKEDGLARWCPKAGCGMVVISDPHTPMVRCPNDKCRYAYCHSCKVEWHNDSTCVYLTT